MTGAEDFSFVLEQVPGAYLMLGACPPGADPATAPNNHATDAVFDDSVLATGAALYAELALQRPPRPRHVASSSGGALRVGHRRERPGHLFFDFRVQVMDRAVAQQQ